MALGDQSPAIRIEVDQRLPMEAAIIGDRVEDESVSTEITYFDRIGDTYILEGVLSFSGLVKSARSEEEDNRLPIEYRLPFALRVPVDGQPDFLDVKTRMKEWEMEVAGPNYVQVKAGLMIQGLDARNGYSFYCGDQEDLVQPSPDFSFNEREQKAIDSDSVTERYESNNIEEEEAGYREQDWLMEQESDIDEQDTLIFEPGSRWQEQIKHVTEQQYHSSQEEDARVREDAQEETFQFEALAEEVEVHESPNESTETVEVTENISPHGALAYQMEVPVSKSVVEFAKSTERELVDSSSQVGSKIVPKSEAIPEAKAKPVEVEIEKETEVEVNVDVNVQVQVENEEEAEFDSDETPEDKEIEIIQETKAGPKVSLGTVAEQPSSIKLSGLLSGSVTNPSRPVAQDILDADEMLFEHTSDELLDTKEALQTEPEVMENSTELPGSTKSLWGKWMKVESERRYTLKFKIVQTDESLSEVAEHYETPIENLMRANGLTNEQIESGQILFIPGRRP